MGNMLLKKIIDPVFPGQEGYGFLYKGFKFPDFHDQ
jgi:hypothetical protein